MSDEHHGQPSTHATELEPPSTLQRLRALLRISRWLRTSRSYNDVRAEGFGVADTLPAAVEVGERFVSLLRDLEPNDGDRPVPGMAWTVAETATHMLTLLRRGGDPRRADTLEGLRQLNARQIAEVEERDLGELTDLIEAYVSGFRSMIPIHRALWALRVGRWINFPLHVGLWADLATAGSYTLVEFLAHGDDIARATGRSWTITPDHAALALRSCLPATAPWISPEVLNGSREHTTFTFPNVDYALAFEVGEGNFTVHPVARQQATLELDPVELLLAFAGRHEPATEAIARISNCYQPL